MINKFCPSLLAASIHGLNHPEESPPKEKQPSYRMLYNFGETSPLL